MSFPILNLLILMHYSLVNKVSMMLCNKGSDFDVLLALLKMDLNTLAPASVDTPPLNPQSEHTQSHFSSTVVQD